MAVIGQIVHFSFPPAYYEPKAFERTGRIYEPLGVRVFKMLVRRGPLAIFSPAMHMPKDRTIPALQQLDRTMRQAETGHVLIFVLALLFSFYALLRGEFGAAGWMLAFNLLINGYPVMLQRYNRIKLQELIGKQGVLSETPVNHVSSGA